MPTRRWLDGDGILGRVGGWVAFWRLSAFAGAFHGGGTSVVMVWVYFSNGPWPAGGGLAAGRVSSSDGGRGRAHVRAADAVDHPFSGDRPAGSGAWGVSAFRRAARSLSIVVGTASPEGQ